ncbi:MAG: hypothetical protein AAFW83_09020 [Pseudomonadota bacterium]
MSLSNVEMGFLLASVPMALAGLAFSISLSASPFIATIGKALGWPLSIILGYVGGVYWADSLLPDWPQWAGIPIMFGPGFFFTWMAISILLHEDAIEKEIQFARWIGAKIKDYRQKRTAEKTTYRAYAEDE